MRIFLLALSIAVCAAFAPAGDQPVGQAQPYEKIRYPTFKDGRLQSMLEAEQAEAYDLTSGSPRVNLRNVVVTLYDDSEEARASTPEDQPLEVKMVITSDRGFLTRRNSDAGDKPEEVANLEGNVVLRQMRLSRGKPPPPPSTRARRLDPSIETEIHCQHAQWNNTWRKLNGDGEVEFIQENSRIVGTGFLYLADDEALESGNSDNFKDWGGIAFIEHNARMEIDHDPDGAGPAESVRTEITCKDTASYKLREREIQFEKDVRVQRPDLLIESDILKVFLLREDEIQAAENGQAKARVRPDGDKDDGVVAGMVKSIVATIGKRPGAVVITGYDAVPGRRRGVDGPAQFTAKGGRADYDYTANRITLTDSRTDRVPEVEFDQDRISDRTLEFVFAHVDDFASADAMPLESLTASGGQGQVLLRSRREGAIAGPQTEISYKGDLAYTRAEGRIRFRDSVFLKRGDLRMRAESIDVRMMSDGSGALPNQLSRIIAETDVNLQSSGREARAQRAEYQVDHEQNLDTVRLYGPPQKTPPHPWIKDDFGNQISAPEILMQRLASEGGRGKPRHLLTASGGTAACEFYTNPTSVIDKGKIISIKCENGMEYNEARRIASFVGQVMAVSDAPEDNYVLTSDKLDVYLSEKPDPDAPGEMIVSLRRVDANGSARLTQDVRVCEAQQIIRDFPTEKLDEGDIYLEGLPATAERPAKPAIYREDNRGEIGAVFTAPRIMATATGSTIRANGPGELSMPDELPGQRVGIHFDGAALFESKRDGEASDAKFRKGVYLAQPSRNLLVAAEEMDAGFQRDPKADENRPRVPGEVTVERIGRLRRAEARVSVKLEHVTPQGKRVATGDRGVVEFTNNGNVVTLSVDRRRNARSWVMVRDHDGMTLVSPLVEIRDMQGVTRASGPGELQIPAGAGDSGASRAPTRIVYGENGQMVYNELALNIRITDNVRIVQAGAGGSWSAPSLDGRCDRVEIILNEAPDADMTQEEATSRVSRMDAIGNVLLRVYAEAPPENPNIDWLSRPGTTFFTRGDQSLYDTRDGRIVVSCTTPGRQPQLLLSMVEGGGAARRQRLKADRFILNTNTVPRRWYFEGQLESKTLKEGDAFDFE